MYTICEADTLLLVDFSFTLSCWVINPEILFSNSTNLSRLSGNPTTTNPFVKGLGLILGALSGSLVTGFLGSFFCFLSAS